MPKKSGGVMNWFKKGVATAAVIGAGVGGYEVGKSIDDADQKKEAEYIAKAQAYGGVEKYEAHLKQELQESGEKYWAEQLSNYYSRLDGKLMIENTDEILNLEMRARAIEILQKKGYNLHFGIDTVNSVYGGPHTVIEGLVINHCVNYYDIKIPVTISCATKIDGADSNGFEIVKVLPSDYSSKEISIIQLWKSAEHFSDEGLEKATGLNLNR